MEESGGRGVCREDATKAEANFVFTNTSSGPVEVKRVQTSCCCTQATTPQKTYQPGESGTVNVVFAFGNRKGLQEKTILVTMGRSTSEPLKLKVHIPDSFAIDKETLSWKVGDASENKSFGITATEAEITIKTAKLVGKGFEYSVRELKSGKRYEVEVRPLDTQEARKASIRIEIADPSSRVVYLPVEVEP